MSCASHSASIRVWKETHISSYHIYTSLITHIRLLSHIYVSYHIYTHHTALPLECGKRHTYPLYIHIYVSYHIYTSLITHIRLLSHIYASHSASIRVCNHLYDDTTNSYVKSLNSMWDESIICDMTHVMRITQWWMTHSYVTWRIHMWNASILCEMNQS